MLINISNHPSERWSEEQRSVATDLYGIIQDIAFPRVSPEATSSDIAALAAGYVEQAATLAKAKENEPFAVHIMGEMTLTFKVVQSLKEMGITCVASTTFRDTLEHPDGSKTTHFRFIQFREYV